MYYVVDLNTTEKAETLEQAMNIAEEWREGQRDIVSDMDDDRLRREYKSPPSPCGFDNGDIEIWESETDDWSDGECVKVYSGRDIEEEEYTKRGLHRYTVLFGYNSVPSEEWEKGSFDDIDEAVKFCQEYPEKTTLEKDGYIYIVDNESEGRVADWICGGDAYWELKA